MSEIIAHGLAMMAEIITVMNEHQAGTITSDDAKARYASLHEKLTADRAAIDAELKAKGLPT